MTIWKGQKMEQLKLIGWTTCPECGHKKAAVRRDKNGHPYRSCELLAGGCGAQYFARTDPDRAARLVKSVQEAAPAAAITHPDPVPARDPVKPEPVAPKKAGVFEALYGARQ